MPAGKPAEFRRKAVELARSGESPVAKIAGDLGIAESCLRRWMKADESRPAGVRARPGTRGRS
jgi:transposase